MSLLFDQNLSRRLPVLLAAELPASEQVLLTDVPILVAVGLWVATAALILALT